MAADTITFYKYALGSGEAAFESRVGADNNVNTTKTRQPFVVEIKVNKDIYDQLHADTITALGAVTIADVVADVFGSS